MSKIALSPNASGTGVFTIASPSGNTDRTLTLPDEAGTVLTSAGVPASAMPAGSVLQMVNATTSSSISTTSSSDVASGFSVTITPTDAANKIFIQMAGGAMDYSGSASGNGLQVSVYRNGTKLADIAGGTYGNPYGLSLSGSFVDSTHSSTSALTYQLYLRSSGGVTGYLINSGSSITRPLVLTAMEIAA